MLRLRSADLSCMERPAIRSLTGIRFFAAIHVVFFHYAPNLPHVPRNVVENGYLAVGLFFVLSGFVLAYKYGGRPLDTRRFWRARFARIYPAYLLAFVLIAPAVAVRLLWVDPRKFVESGLAAAGLLQAWFPSLALTWNGPGWSLSNEAFFYLLFPITLAALARLSSRMLWFAFFVLSGAALAPPVCYFMRVGTQGTELILYTPVFRLPEFALGAVCGLLYLRGERIPRLLIPASMTLAVFAAVSCDLVPALLRGSLAAPLFAFFVFALASSDGAIGRFLARRPLQTLGDSSYALYILQSPVMAWFLLGTRGIQTASSRASLSWTSFLAYCILLVVVSLACYAWLETPARRWVLGLHRRQSGVRAPTVEYGVAPFESGV
jgi:peptidoglycan/LPS O-acetylase OafA/YrhL